MKYYDIPLSESKVLIVFFAITSFGALLLYTQDIRLMIAGFAIATIGLHELGHLTVLMIKRYPIVGIRILYWPPGGVGPLPGRDIELEDSTLVYFSGLLAIVPPIFTMLYTIEFGILFLIGAILLSAFDIQSWWQLRKEKTKG